MLRLLMITLSIFIVGCSKPEDSIKNNPMDEIKSIEMAPLNLVLENVEGIITIPEGISSLVELGSVESGSKVSYRVNLTAKNEILNLNIDGFRNAETFLFKSTTCASATLKKNRSCYVNIEFIAGESGYYEELISFNEGASVLFQMTSLPATPIPAYSGLSFSENIVFGDYNHTYPLSKKVIIKNDSREVKNIVIDSSSIGSEFSIGSSSCSSSLKENRSCQLEIVFVSSQKLSEDLVKNSTISINSKEVSLSVNHKKFEAIQSLSMSDSVIELGSIENSVKRSVVVRNLGDELSSLSISLPSGIASSSKTNCGESLKKNRTCSIELVIDPESISISPFTLDVVYGNTEVSSKVTINGSKSEGGGPGPVEPVIPEEGLVSSLNFPRGVYSSSVKARTNNRTYLVAPNSENILSLMMLDNQGNFGVRYTHPSHDSSTTNPISYIISHEDVAFFKVRGHNSIFKDDGVSIVEFPISGTVANESTSVFVFNNEFYFLSSNAGIFLTKLNLSSGVSTILHTVGSPVAFDGVDTVYYNLTSNIKEILYYNVTTGNSGVAIPNMSPADYVSGGGILSAVKNSLGETALVISYNVPSSKNGLFVKPAGGEFSPIPSYDAVSGNMKLILFEDKIYFTASSTMGQNYQKLMSYSNGVFSTFGIRAINSSDVVNNLQRVGNNLYFLAAPITNSGHRAIAIFDLTTQTYSNIIEGIDGSPLNANSNSLTVSSTGRIMLAARNATQTVTRWAYYKDGILQWLPYTASSFHPSSGAHGITDMVAGHYWLHLYSNSNPTDSVIVAY